MLSEFIARSETVLAAWDAYSEEHTDADGLPYDEASYGWRMVQRDSETWRAFQPFHQHARVLLATAQAHLQHLAAADIEPGWPWQLAELATALNRLDDLRDEWAKAREEHRSSPPGFEETVDALAERNEEAWSYLNTWATHGPVFLALQSAAVKAPPSTRVAVAASALPASTARTTGRRS
ncbi:hypothetical protein AB0C52_25060 [Streptomyces sp. NPDC048717]|uniref:hypothetical protein n=1 Tax=unclassified Streptomyces TaxID=2593676 RepID=UPI0034215F74